MKGAALICDLRAGASAAAQTSARRSAASPRRTPSSAATPAPSRWSTRAPSSRRSAAVTANPGRNAEVALSRGGSVLVCQTTSVHLTAGKDDSLLLALDRGAMEIRSKASTADVIITPDLRFTMAEAGTLDLRMRVTFNGDTCVENRGRKAPQLNISDSFGEASYLLKPGQHVMFEHGSLKSVMDRETTPCGCPPEEKRPSGLTIADAMVRGGQTSAQPSAPLTPAQAAAAHPFPTAVSDGLAPPTAPAPETPGERHVQVASTLQFDPAEPASTPSPAPAPAAAAPLASAPIQPGAAPATHSHNPFLAVGHFFKRLFVR